MIENSLKQEGINLRQGKVLAKRQMEMLIETMMNGISFNEEKRRWYKEFEGQFGVMENKMLMLVEK